MLIDVSQLDEAVFLWINQFNTPLSDTFWLFVTEPLNWLPLYIMVIILLFYKQKFLNGSYHFLVLGTTVFITHLITSSVKYLVSRPRPSSLHHIAEQANIIFEPQHYSFFSGHASTSFAASIFIYLLLKSRFSRIGFIFIWPVLFSASRLFVGVHYPSDIIVGACFGIFMGSLSYQLYSRLGK
ncbi:phosphatase PAP2 family protein [Psychroflexus sp. ALD_RP9]|uniref:phosphatase PAP2 family protein n=1 Tax=Psychroflexus sp. ALD_RP9 TaxID=2777186 RepID=UPI001A8D485E|nr:phosphatase PAP2 family protein [Psychroflexus sp. ALD_RP9]QSS97553.1 phosphatase PAP2 family protein [Psychroflexus sp. ALD_RP9]